VYDFTVPGSENFIAGNGVFCHNTYGPRMHPDDGRVVSNFIMQSLEEKPLTIYGDGSHTRSFCYVDDIIEALVRFMDQDQAIGPINLGNPNETSMLELAEKIIQLTKTTSNITHQDLPADDPDITKAKQILDWQPTTPFKEGLTKTVEYFRSLRK
jgi:UDP-glucuronate decarboxylase